MEPFWLTRPEFEARRLRRSGKTVREIAKVIIARFTGAAGARLTKRERNQVDSLRDLRDGRVERTIREWLAKGRLRRGSAPSPPPPGVPVWVGLVRCVTCGREEAVLRKVLTRRDVGQSASPRVPLPSGREGFGYCRKCKRWRRYRVVDSERVPTAEVRALVTAWAKQPPLARSRFLVEKVWGLARVGRVRRGESRFSDARTSDRHHPRQRKPEKSLHPRR